MDSIASRYKQILQKVNETNPIFVWELRAEFWNSQYLYTKFNVPGCWVRDIEFLYYVIYWIISL